MVETTHISIGIDTPESMAKDAIDFVKQGVNIIKAFRVDNDFVFGQVNNYKPHVDFFLFDAKGDGYGGNGIAFDWSILKKYDNQKPYFFQ